jgi:hypothetical protein
VISDQAASTAAAILEIRRSRAESLPGEIFADPAWDLLLELFVADAHGRRLTGHDVSRRCGIAPTVLSRWLLVISERGLIVGDGSGDLNDEITLSGKGMDGVERVLLGSVALRIGSSAI